MTKKTILFTYIGDEGYTGLLGTDRVPKYDSRPEAFGTVDEASAFMGLVRVNPMTSDLTKALILESQRDLWILMGELASTPEVKLPQRIEASRITWLEAETEKLGQMFPPLNQFVIAGDTPVATRLDVARTVIRRAERHTVKLVHEGKIENLEVIRYLNRLSSLLFALARYEDYLAGEHSTIAKDVK